MLGFVPIGKLPVGGLLQNLKPGLSTNSQTFFAPTVSATYTLTPGLFTDGDTFFAPTVSPGAVTLTPSLFTDGDTFFAPVVSASYSLTPSLFTNSQIFFSPTVSASNTLLPGLFTNSNTFFSPTATAAETSPQTVLMPGGGMSRKRLEKWIEDIRAELKAEREAAETQTAESVAQLPPADDDGPAVSPAPIVFAPTPQPLVVPQEPVSPLFVAHLREIEAQVAAASLASKIAALIAEIEQEIEDEDEFILMMAA